SDNGKLKGIEDVSAEEAGFSTTSDFTLLTVSVMDSDNSITIYFNGTEENFGDFDNITYTKPTDPVLKDIDGMPVESFNSPQPYHNFDLYE
ncbi:MAG: hypothetical protein LBS91_06605, partial [Clostridiales Family XIII bacterium]|nr:hypothetical protein [Clostridiales Family XIII bacterium]